MQQLTPLDSTFVYMESPNTPMHVAGLALYDPSTVPPEKKRMQDVLGHKDIMTEYEKALHLIPHMRRKLVHVPGGVDYPWWVEDRDFDIEFHLRHIALPHPGDWRQLCIQVARIHARGMDMSRPLWESYIIENLDNIPGLPPHSFAVLNKVHHAAIDGATGAQQTMALHTLKPEDDLPAPNDHWRPENDPSGGELLARAWFNSVTAPVRAAQTIGQTIASIRAARAESGGGTFGSIGAGLQNVRAPLTSLNSKVSPNRVFDARVFSLDSLKSIKQVFKDVTLNDIVVTIIGGAVREYMKEQHSVPAESMTAFMPINVRTKEEHKTAGNVVSGTLAPVGTHIADPKERLAYVHEQINTAKGMVGAIGARTMTDLSNLTPAIAMSLGTRAIAGGSLVGYIPPVANMVITNVPGSPVPLYSTGARLMAVFGLMPLTHGMGLMFCIQSHTNVVSIGFTACRSVVPNPEVLAEYIRKSERDLVRAVLGRTEIEITDIADLLRATGTREDQINPQEMFATLQDKSDAEAKPTVAKLIAEKAGKAKAKAKSTAKKKSAPPATNGNGGVAHR